jgi:CheY-like chemotaxis protein
MTRVLYVEPDEQLAKAMHRWFTGRGYDVLLADPRSALLNLGNVDAVVTAWRGCERVAVEAAEAGLPCCVYAASFAAPLGCVHVPKGDTAALDAWLAEVS